MATNTKRVQQQRPSVGRPHNPRKDKMKARRKMSKEEKDRRYMARIERKALAAQMAVCCSSCDEAGKILNTGVPTLRSAPPLWVVENEWLLDCHPLCAKCIVMGERVELCFEGGTMHRFSKIWHWVVCLDCGRWQDGPDGVDTASTALVRMRLEAAMAAREAEIGVLVRRTASRTLNDPELGAMTTRIERLREDRDWVARRLEGESR